MIRRRTAAMMMTMLSFVSGYAANPFLDTPDDKPISAKFRGIEWSDEIGEQDVPLTVRVMTMRIAKMPWGAIFKIEFTDLKSRAKNTRQIRPDYFIVTDERIALLNQEDNDEAVKKISAMDKAPMFEERDVRGITDGKLSYEDGPWTTTIEIKGNECTYRASHNSGHFTEIVWKRGVGLVEYASGYGAHADGFRLKRQK
jgi:hypothetical protein